MQRSTQQHHDTLPLAVPAYLQEALREGRKAEGWRLKNVADQVPPGHRFLLYFRAFERADGNKWEPLTTSKRDALEDIVKTGKQANAILNALKMRHARLFDETCWKRRVTLAAPLFTGSGNPHPVENGFAFLSPYGVPYLAGSGLKGVFRRAAEELALLCDDTHGWTLPLVWALFGFDANSAYLGAASDSEWVRGYDAFVHEVENSPDRVLEQLMKIWMNPRLQKVLEKEFGPENGPLDQPAFLRALRQYQQVRRAVHFQGLLTFFDAVPHPDCQMAVDITNPHHKSYYQGTGQESPHDAEQPVPIFFLVLPPGTTFDLKALPLAQKDALWPLVKDRWQALLDASLGHIAAWLGLGAKTSVGYGVFTLAQQPAQDKLSGRSEEAPPSQREVLKEVEIQKLEEERRRKQEAEEMEQAQRLAAWNALPEDEKILRPLQEKVEAYVRSSEVVRKNIRPDLNRAMNAAVEQASQIKDSNLRQRVAAEMEKMYERVGWADPGEKKEKRQKQEKKRREALEALKK
ncbi:MAG: type III-B CRISPR module RAMP protein Cmr6 [Desulfosoma sp.]|uniref:type III-B CRISPR module RAMP protein Cmr6 n=1 Tax=Desulfosoma sp. TaxID=2603217 RepID=UPI00404A1E19